MLAFNGKLPHGTYPFKGERFSLVFFTHNVWQRPGSAANPALEKRMVDLGFRLPRQRKHTELFRPFPSTGNDDTQVLTTYAGEYDTDSGSSQFFWLLFDSDLTPAGKNLLDGRYSCFGYTTEGARFLSDLKEGDIIQSAKVIQGLDNLKQPKE